MPAGTASPNGWVAWSTSPCVHPGSAVTVQVAGSTRTPFIGEMSIIRPSSQLAKPAPLCPPPRMAIGSPVSRP